MSIQRCGSAMQLSPVLGAAAQTGVALVRRLAALPDDGLLPGDRELAAAGAISPSMVAVARGDAATEFLGWWSRRHGEAAQSDGRWLELGRERFAAVSLVQDEGCDVSYWNLHERPLSALGRADAGGRPAAAVHGLRRLSRRPAVLAERGRDPGAGDRRSGPVASCAGNTPSRSAPPAGLRRSGRSPGVERLGNGQRVDHLVRALWDEALADGKMFGDPLEAARRRRVRRLDARARPGAAARPGSTVTSTPPTSRAPTSSRRIPTWTGRTERACWPGAWGHGRREMLGELLPSPAGRRSAIDGAEHRGQRDRLPGRDARARRGGAAVHRRLPRPGFRSARPRSPPTCRSDDDQRRSTRYGSHGYEDLRSDGGAGRSTSPASTAIISPRWSRTRGRGSSAAGRRSVSGAGRPMCCRRAGRQPSTYVDEVWVYSNFMAENLGRLLPMPVVVVPPAIVDPRGRPVSSWTSPATIASPSCSCSTCSAPCGARTRSGWSTRSPARSRPARARG